MGRRCSSTSNEYRRSPLQGYSLQGIGKSRASWPQAPVNVHQIRHAALGRDEGPFTSAKSILIPFALPLYVGGIKLSIAKLTVAPPAFAASAWIVKTLFVFGAFALGYKSAVNCRQVVWLPEMPETDVDARTSPEVVCKVSVKEVAVKAVEEVGKR